MTKKSVYSFLLFLLCLPFVALTNAAQESAKAEQWNNALVDYRPADKEKMEAYKQMKVYKFESYEKPETLWQKFKRWVWLKLSKSNINENIIWFGLIGFAILIFLFIILKLLGVQITGLFVFGHKSKAPQIMFTQKQDDIHSVNMEKMLTQAIKNKAYRNAVRLLYLLSLRQLDALELIHWRPWKTNREYYYELAKAEHKQLFSELQRSYEYIWYGQFTVEDEKFNVVYAQFEQFESAINANKKIRA